MHIMENRIKKKSEVRKKIRMKMIKKWDAEFATFTFVKVANKQKKLEEKKKKNMRTSFLTVNLALNKKNKKEWKDGIATGLGDDDDNDDYTNWWHTNWLEWQSDATPGAFLFIIHKSTYI